MSSSDADPLQPTAHSPIEAKAAPEPWMQIHIDASSDQAPLLELLFDSLGALSVTFGDAGNEPILEPAPRDTPLWQHTRVTALFEGEKDANALRELIAQTLPRDLSSRLEFERLPDQPWERAWLVDFRPMRFGERLWVCPEGQRPDTDGAVTVRLEPGLAFGTGTHPSTALCLRWLDKANVIDRSLIDYGCGSGILAIAALRLGAASATAVDHDPQALEATRTNAARNEVLDRLSIASGTGHHPGRTDILLANILAETLIKLCDRLSDAVKPGGTIVLSGILVPQTTAVSNAYSRYFEMQSPMEEQEWALLEGRRKVDCQEIIPA